MATTAPTDLSGFQQSEVASRRLKRFKNRFNVFVFSILGQVALSLLYFLLLGVLGTSLGSNMDASTGLGIGIVTILQGLAQFALYIAAIVGFALFHHDAWAAIANSDFTPRTTPGRAIGLLFVPVFNLYWSFVSFEGFVRDYNHYLEAHNLELKKGKPLYGLLPPAITLLVIVSWVFWLALSPSGVNFDNGFALLMGFFGLAYLGLLVTSILMIAQEYKLVKRLLEYQATLY